jgi:acetate---CoA ligase (ADP-forming)
MTARNLTPMFDPASIAVVGASDDTTRIGGRVFRNLLGHGYRGRLVPVRRGSTVVQGIEALPGVEELEGPVDLAILAVNAAQTVEVTKRLLDNGTRHFLSFAAGIDTEALLSVLAPYDDAALAGPNSNGIWSVEHQLIASFGSEAEVPEIHDGPVAIVTHSGSLGGAVARRLQAEGIGTRYVVSAGNEADLSMADYINFFLGDPTVRVIGTYLEGVSDGPQLRDALWRARVQGVQVVAFVAGQSRQARQATMSHTGKAMSSPALYRAVLEDCGVSVVASTTELTRACQVATAGFGPIIPRVGAVGISGGMLAIIADACEADGLPFAELASETESALEGALPGFSRAGNPVDLTGAVLERQELLPTCARAVATDPAVDALVVGLDNKGYDRICDATWIEPLARDVRKPIALVLWDQPFDPHPQLERSLLAAGVAVVTDPTDTARVLRWMCRADHAGDVGSVPAWPGTGPRVTHHQLQSWSGQQEFAGSLALRTPATVVVTGGMTDCDALAGLAPPLVVKALPNRVQHKADRGMVVTGLITHEAAVAAANRLRAALPPGVPVIVQEQVPGVEVLLSVTVDPDWGPVLSVGAGGAMVELLNDIVTLPAPCDLDRMAQVLHGRRLWALLRGFRGRPPADVDALLVAAERLQRTFLCSDLAELELNPVMVAPQGEGAFMVDVLSSEGEPHG